MSADNERANENNDTSDQYGILISAFAATLGCSILDLDQLCNQLLDLDAIRQSEWDNVKRETTNSPRILNFEGI
jgi:hypothetical protein